jgi:hypothetical protein
MDASRLTFSALSLVDHVALSPVGSGHITADKRVGSCRASTQMPSATSFIRKTLYEMLGRLLEKRTHVNKHTENRIKDVKKKLIRMKK